MACTTVTICNLLSYEIKRVNLKDLKESGSIRETITSYIPGLTLEERLKIYIIDHDQSGFLESLNYPDRINLKSLRRYNDIKLGSKVIIFNLFLIGQSMLNQDSFTERSVGNVGDSIASLLEEKQEALQLFALFVAKISCKKRDSCSELNHMVTSCLENKYIERNLSGFLSSDAAFPDCDLEDIGERLDKFQSNDDYQERNIDSLINICNALTSETCGVLNSKIQRQNYKPDWADVLKQDASATISLTNQSPSRLIEIHSNVFEYIECLHSKRSSTSLQKIPLNGDLTSLGKGGFGSTFLYTPNIGLNPKQSLVIKRNEMSRTECSKPSWFREGHHTLQLCHENIIKYFGKPILYGNLYYCIMENGGNSLEDIYFAEDGSGSHMDLDKIGKASLQVSSALNYLHTRNPIVIHRDIRTANVTCNDSGVYKLIDFGLSSEKKMEESSKIVSDTDWGNHLWKSPEFCWHINRGAATGNQDDHLPEPGRKTDIWMFGVFVLELFAFPKRPSYFSRYSKCATVFMKHLTEQLFNMECPIQECLKMFGDKGVEIPSKFKDVLERCLEFDESSRADSEEIFELCQQLITVRGSGVAERGLEHSESENDWIDSQQVLKLCQPLQLHEWIENLDQGGHIKRSVEVPNLSFPVEATISSNIFDLCGTLDCTSNANLTLLGKGGFANTFRFDIIGSIQSNSVISVVIKKNSLCKRNDEKPVWYREACHTRQLSHDNIIKYFGKPILYKKFYYCIMEYGGTSLYQKYHCDRGNVTMSRSDICIAMLHIAKAIKYLHHHSTEKIVIHRDIRTSNVTVSDSGVYKLIDFGISSEKCQQQSTFESDPHLGSHLWKSPEFCKYIISLTGKNTGGDTRPGIKSDIWMYGVFTMEMISFPGRPQFFEDYDPNYFGSLFNFLPGLVEKKINLIDYIDESCDPAVREVVERCLKYSENDRVDSQQLLELCQQSLF